MSKLLPLILVGGLPQAGKTTFINKVSSMIPNVLSFNEEDYVRQTPNFYEKRGYALSYSEEAKFLVENAMVKDVAAATAAQRPVIVESNFFVLPEMRKFYREKVLTPCHLPIYVSIYVGEETRARNKPLNKYMSSDDLMFVKGNRRPKLGDGFVSMSARDLLGHINAK